MPYKIVDGEKVWFTAEEWAEEKARRSALNRKSFKEAQKEVRALAPLDTTEGKRQRIQLFKEKLLTEENGNKIIKKVLDIAMDDDHPGQSAALKMCLDRMLPSSLFEEKKVGLDRPSISINITGIGESQVKTIEGEVIDG